MEVNNIILALETIYKTAEKSELKLDVFATIPVEIKRVCDYFEVNTIEAILLATCFVKSCFNVVELPEIIKHFGLENHSFLIYLEKQNKMILQKIKGFFLFYLLSRMRFLFNVILITSC